ncbi:MAG: c-type cytochrome [Thiobacillus sp.]
MIRTTALLATLLLASPALSNPVPMPTRMPAGPVSLDAFKGWVAVPVAVMINGQITPQWMLVPAQAVAGVAAASPAPAAEAGAPALSPANPASTHGRVIAATCASCHGTNGISHGAIPGLAGLEKDYFVKQMKAFKDGSRAATVMHQHAVAYTDDEIEQMAAIFAAMKP